MICCILNCSKYISLTPWFKYFLFIWHAVNISHKSFLIIQLDWWLRICIQSTCWTGSWYKRVIYKLITQLNVWLVENHISKILIVLRIISNRNFSLDKTWNYDILNWTNKTWKGRNGWFKPVCKNGKWWFFE